MASKQEWVRFFGRANLRAVATEFWARNPYNYIRECVAADQNWITVDKGIVRKFGMDAQVWASMYFPGDFRCMVIGDQGAVETDRDHTSLNPKAIHPTWRYGVNDIHELEDWCADPTIAPSIIGQERRVVITHLPNMRENTTKKFLLLLKELQDDYPETIIHIAGTYSWNAIFGLGFKSADFEVRNMAQRGKVLLPNGKYVQYDTANQHRKWLNLVGVSTTTLDVPSERCIANILSLQWAAKNWNVSTIPSTTFKAKPMTDKDLERLLKGEGRTTAPVTVSFPQTVQGKTLPGDRLACDYCSLARSCRAYRVGSVCTLPKSSGLELYEYFETRDSHAIIAGLSKIIEIDAERLLQGRDIEKNTNELSRDVTGISKDLFSKGLQLARLVDPSLRPGGGLSINVSQNNGDQNVQLGNLPTSQMQAARAIEILEEGGVPRRDITPPMVERVLAGDESGVFDEYCGSLPALETHEITDG